jgi:hypothetical protein
MTLCLPETSSVLIPSGDVIATAPDFFLVNTVTGMRLCPLAFLKHRSRKLHIAGLTAPFRAWATQQALT